jgi:hypothetical protein
MASVGRLHAGRQRLGRPVKKLILAFLVSLAIIPIGLKAQTTIQYRQFAAVPATWTSGTALNTRVTVPATNLSSVTVTLNATSTMTAGAIQMQIYDGSVWYPKGCTRNDLTGNDTTFALSVVQQSWLCIVGGALQFGVQLTTAITGTGTANLKLFPSAAPVALPGNVILNGSAVGNNPASGTNSEALVFADAALTTTAALQTAAVANGTGATKTVTGEASMLVTVSCTANCTGTTASTITFQESENATNFSAVSCQQLGGANVGMRSSVVLTSVINTLWWCPVQNAVSFQAPMTNYNTGTFTVTAHASPVPFVPSTPVPSSIDSIVQFSIAATVLTIGSVPGQLADVVCSNNDATNPAYLQIFDTTAGVTLGSTTPLLFVYVPPKSPGGATNLNRRLSNGLKVAATTTASGATGVSTAIDCNFGFRY